MTGAPADGVYAAFGKRLFDMVCAAAALALLWPVMLIVAAAVRIEDGGPALFRQQRVGRFGRLFTFFKFRSMPVNTGDVPSHLARSLTVTRIGRIIRRTNLDELPQLWNILRGEMSFVGPRPALPRQQDVCRLRHDAGADRRLPGLTGLAQVDAFDGMSPEEKVAWDSRYASRLTFRGDLEILLRTFGYLMKPPPAY